MSYETRWIVSMALIGANVFLWWKKKFGFWGRVIAGAITVVILYSMNSSKQ